MLGLKLIRVSKWCPRTRGAWRDCIALVLVTLFIDPFTALTARYLPGLCEEIVSGREKTVEIPTGHITPECNDNYSQFIFQLTNHRNGNNGYFQHGRQQKYFIRFGLSIFQIVTLPFVR